MNWKKKQDDLDFGFRSEDTARPFLNRFVDIELYNTRTDDNDTYNKFDYRAIRPCGKRIKLELKTRRCKFGDFPDLQFELGKIYEAEEYLKQYPDAECYFVWRCIHEGWGKEAFYYWEYHPDQWFIGDGGRHDRGVDEWKKLCKVKNKFIKKMF
tara:strand:- start:4337 stop:4798 length:462 start_codon:yes stop_codon:yes gene_type:complete